MDMLKMMKQVKELKKKQKALASKTVEFTAAGVTVKMSGDMQPKSISIPQELIAAGNVKKVETAVLDAFKGALSQAQAVAAEEMKSLTAGLNLPF